MKDYLILLYYCYTKIEDPEAFRIEHHLFCIENKLRGRIIIAKEGINGTVSGRKSDCEKYMKKLHADPRFSTTEFKTEPYDTHVFQKLNVRVKEEIVHSGLKHIDPNLKTGTYIEPEEFRQIKDGDDVVLVDVRSNYEHNVGKFKNAISLDIDNFRDFPTKIDELKIYRDKKIITYCTGGIKCEKASAYLIEQGFENVYQLHGGIIKYGLEEGGEDFEGKCYVFDRRVVAEVNKVNPKVISTCHICKIDCDRMVNCANPECNKHVPMCAACAEKMEGACSSECNKHPKKRTYNGSGYYPKELNGYDPYRGLQRKK
ncbi:MAG: rhodanese-related sulfurtransferase [Cytophagales bacterium]|nr:rhodanese-related sulfurtransferase [Cytophagales bacterium]